MRLKTIPRLAIAVLIVTGVSASAQDLVKPAYEVKSLSTLPGGISAQGTAINDLGVVSGFSTVDPTGATMHATVWAGGAPLDLGTLGGPNSAIAWPNHDDRGRFAGIAETPELDALGEFWSCGLAVFPGNPDGHVCLGFFWKDGRMTKLPTLGGVNGFAASINNRDQIAGWAETKIHDSTCNTPQVLQFEAVLWEPDAGTTRELMPLPGDPDGAATAINDLGQTVGISGLCSNAVGGDSARHAVTWDADGRVHEIANLGGVA